jgi:hypothetical protein
MGVNCNIPVFQVTKNMSFLKFFLQLCEACSIYVEPESNSLTRRCIHVELVAGVCWCSWVGFVLSCGVRSTQVHSNLLSNSLWIHLWVSLENPPLNLFMNPHFEFIPSSLPNLFPIPSLTSCQISSRNPFKNSLSSSFQIFHLGSSSRITNSIRAHLEVPVKFQSQNLFESHLKPHSKPFQISIEIPSQNI